MGEVSGLSEVLAVALSEAMHKRLADWQASTSEAYFPLDSEHGPKVLVNYLLFGPGSVSEVLAARAAAPDALRERVEALADEVEPDEPHVDHGGGNGENVLYCARCWRDGLRAVLAERPD